jgi:hypothetical protein
MAYNSVSLGNDDDAKNFANAIETAYNLAEPYVKSQIGIARAELSSKLADLSGDYEAKQKAVQSVRDQLMQDVTSQKDFLTLDQQGDLARQAQSYGQDLLTIADQAAEKGLTFATGQRSRAQAESLRKSQYEDVVQSSQRQYNYSTKALELKAARGDTEAQTQLAELNRNRSTLLGDIGRSAEKVLGSGRTDVPGYTPVGGVMGSIDQTKQEGILRFVDARTKTSGSQTDYTN